MQKKIGHRVHMVLFQNEYSSSTIDFDFDERVFFSYTLYCVGHMMDENKMFSSIVFVYKTAEGKKE